MIKILVNFNISRVFCFSKTKPKSKQNPNTSVNKKDFYFWQYSWLGALTQPCCSKQEKKTYSNRETESFFRIYCWVTHYIQKVNKVKIETHAVRKHTSISHWGKPNPVSSTVVFTDAHKLSAESQRQKGNYNCTHSSLPTWNSVTSHSLKPAAMGS